MKTLNTSDVSLIDLLSCEKLENRSFEDVDLKTVKLPANMPLAATDGWSSYDADDPTKNYDLSGYDLNNPKDVKSMFYYNWKWVWTRESSGTTE